MKASEAALKFILCSILQARRGLAAFRAARLCFPAKEAMSPEAQPQRKKIDCRKAKPFRTEGRKAAKDYLLSTFRL